MESVYTLMEKLIGVYQEVWAQYDIRELLRATHFCPDKKMLDKAPGEDALKGSSRPSRALILSYSSGTAD